MTDIIPGSDLTPKPSEKGDQNPKGFSDPSGIQHHHSSGSHRQSKRHHHHQERRTGEQRERSGYRRTENLLAHRILPVVGVVFILIALYLSVTSLEFFGFFRKIVSDGYNIILGFFHSSGTKVHHQVTLVNTGP